VIYKSLYGLDRLTEALEKPSTFSIEQIQKDIIQVPGDLCPNLLSYVIKLACGVLDESHEEKYAQVVALLLKQNAWWCFTDKPLWNENGMWGESWFSASGMTALQKCVDKDLTRIVPILLKHADKKEVNQTKGGITALHLAKSYEVAEMLLKAGALVNVQDEDGNTPLHDCRSDIVPLLLKHNADHAISSRYPFTIWRANYHTDADVLREKYKALDPAIEYHVTDDGRAPFHEGYYPGLTPLMSSVFEPEKLKVFLAVLPREAVMARIKSLYVLANERMIKPDNDESLQLLKKYEEEEEAIRKDIERQMRKSLEAVSLTTDS
jgi:hypothetical protein